MGKPVATKKSGDICFAFPDVCNTPSPSGAVPIPYPNTGQLGDAQEVATSIVAKGNPLIIKKSVIQKTTGDEAGTGGGVKSGLPPGGKVIFKTYSGSVKAEGEFIVRMGDTTEQNDGNAIGQVLGGEPTVLVGD